MFKRNLICIRSQIWSQPRRDGPEVVWNEHCHSARDRDYAGWLRPGVNDINPLLSFMFRANNLWDLPLTQLSLMLAGNFRLPIKDGQLSKTPTFLQTLGLVVNLKIIFPERQWQKKKFYNINNCSWWAIMVWRLQVRFCFTLRSQITSLKKFTWSWPNPTQVFLCQPAGIFRQLAVPLFNLASVLSIFYFLSRIIDNIVCGFALWFILIPREGSKNL